MVSLGVESLQRYPFSEGVGNTHSSESTEGRAKAGGTCVLEQSLSLWSAEPGGRGSALGDGTS